MRDMHMRCAQIYICQFQRETIAKSVRSLRIWTMETYHRFYQIKSRIQADANIRLFSWSTIKMIVINGQTSSSHLCILLWQHLEIKSNSNTKRWNNGNFMHEITFGAACWCWCFCCSSNNSLAQFYRYSLILRRKYAQVISRLIVTQSWEWKNKNAHSMCTINYREKKKL